MTCIINGIDITKLSLSELRDFNAEMALERAQDEEVKYD